MWLAIMVVRAALSSVSKGFSVVLLWLGSYVAAGLLSTRMTLGYCASAFLDF